MTVYDQLTNAFSRQSEMAALECYNPLLGKSVSQLQAIFDWARSGSYAYIQRIYHEIEQTDPVLLVCTDRRTGYLPGIGYTVSAKAGHDDVLADEQRAAVEELVDSIDNLPEAVEHLDLAFFRGYSHIAPIRSGSSIHMQLLDSWNFNQDQQTGQWWWNPSASWEAPGGPGQYLVPDGEMITVSRPRRIDYPAMFIYMRHALGDKDWGRFLERYGIPPCIIIMPELTNKDDAPRYEEAARKVANAVSGTLPYGSQVQYATDARGTDPFSAFIRHQEELLVLLATGGTLTSLAQSGTGTLAGDAQMQVWESITARDAAIIGSVINRTLCHRMLRQTFPGKPILAEFALGSEPKRSQDEVFEMAAKAKAAGYIVSQDDLEELTGLHLERDTAGMGGLGGGFVANSRAIPLQNVAKPLQKRLPASEVSTDVAADSIDSRAIVGALSDDLADVAADVQALLDGDEIDPAKAQELIDKLDRSGAPSAKRFGAAMAKEMAKAVADLDKGGQQDE